MRHTSAAAGVFFLFSELWRWWTMLNCEMPSSSNVPRAIHRFYPYGLEHSLGIYGFRLSWPYLIVKTLANLEEFLAPSSYSKVINCTFTFDTTTVFSCFYDIIAQFELKTKSLKIMIFFTFLCNAFKSHGEGRNAQVSTSTTTILPTTAEVREV